MQNCNYKNDNIDGEQMFSERLKLNIITYNQDATEVELINNHYKLQRHHRVNFLLGLICLYSTYRSCGLMQQTNVESWFKISPADVVFLIILICLIYFICQLIEREKFLFCRDFGLQLQTFRFPSRKSTVFIPTGHIFDVCINEVIEDLNVHYMLIIRTKSGLFGKKPIIPVFNSLKPPINCLEILYKHLSNMINELQNT